MILSRQRVDPTTQRTHIGFTAKEITVVSLDVKEYPWRTFYIDPQTLWAVRPIYNEERTLVGEQLWGEKLFDSSLKMRLT